jgi:dipeptide/tripeptide permease
MSAVYGDYYKAKFLSIIIIVIGSLLFLIELVRSFSISWLGIILILIGAGLFSVIRATANEFYVLRQELFEIRKLAQENSKETDQSRKQGML